MNKLNIDPDISLAKTLDTAFYTDPEYFEKSKEKIFAKGWHYAGETRSLQEPGSIHPTILLPDFLNEHLFVSHDKQGAVQCFPNVCTHRGALLIDQPCKREEIRCPYHGRRFSLDGKFISMPEFKEVQNFPTEEDNLKSLPLKQIGPMLFTSLSDSDAEPYFGDMLKRISWMPLDQFTFRPEFSVEFSVNAHWALYCENYLEGFHIPFVHASLNQVIDFGQYSTELFRYSSLQLGIAKENEMAFEVPPSSPDQGQQIAAYYFWVFPNLMFNFYPWGLSLNIVSPRTSGQCRVTFHTFMWDESKYNQGAGSNLNRVEKEDEEVVESVQKGIRSRFYTHGRYSVKHEKGTHHFHRLIHEFMSK